MSTLINLSDIKMKEKLDFLEPIFVKNTTTTTTTTTATTTTTTTTTTTFVLNCRELGD